MHRSFQHLDHLLHAIEVESFRQTKIDGRHYKRLPPWLTRHSQAHAQEVIYGFFEGFSGSAGFLLQPAGYIVIEGKRRAHVMMLQQRHHDVNRQAS